MKREKNAPGAWQGTEGHNDKTYNPSNTPECNARQYPTGRKPKIKLTPLRYHGEFWGWLARTDKDHFCWGLTKQQAWHRLAAALKQADERK